MQKQSAWFIKRQKPEPLILGKGFGQASEENYGKQANNLYNLFLEKENSTFS